MLMFNTICRWFLSCMGYPDCRAAIWFPDFVLNVSVDDAVCDVVSMLSNNQINSFLAEPSDRNCWLSKLFSLSFVLNLNSKGTFERVKLVLMY